MVYLAGNAGTPAGCGGSVPAFKATLRCGSLEPLFYFLSVKLTAIQSQRNLHDLSVRVLDED